MKYSVFIFSLLFSILTFGQNREDNLKKGFIAKGYDVVSYFDNKPVEGKKGIEIIYKNVKYKFSTQENLKKFKQNPQKYIPQYGGWCAYAVGKDNSRADINPETFEIRDGKLYLFYNAWGVNTLKKWKEENPEKLRDQADKNWRK